MTDESTRRDMSVSDEIATLLALQIRLSLNSQAEAIVEMAHAGIRQSRIADLLGTTPGTVKVTIKRAKGRNTRRQGETV